MIHTLLGAVGSIALGFYPAEEGREAGTNSASSSARHLWKHLRPYLGL